MGEKMKIKIFETNRDGKIELTKSELQSLIDEAYEEGRDSMTYTWGSPNVTPAIDGSKITCTDSTIFGQLSVPAEDSCHYSATTTVASGKFKK